MTITHADALAKKVDTLYPQFNINKIYLDSYQQSLAMGSQRYHEAKEEFSREIYFKNHLNLFSLAESEEKLEDLISKSIKGKELKKINFSDISSLCNEQLGNSDGKSAKRFFDNIREILSKKKRKSFYRNTFGSY